MCKSSFSQIDLNLFRLSRSGISASGHIYAPAILSRTASAYFISAPVGASCPSLLSPRLAPSYWAPLCSSITRWTRDHSTRLGSPAFSSPQPTVSTASVAHSHSRSLEKQRHAGSTHFTSSLPVLRLSFLTLAGVSSSAHAIEMLTSRSCHTKSPNQTLELTAARTAFGFVLIKTFQAAVDARSQRP